MSEEMTREQACDTLRNAAWLGTNEERERIERAVELLCGEPCEDTISRQDAIEEIKFGQSYVTKVYPTGELEELFVKENKALEDAVERVKQLPSVTSNQRTGHWIFDDILDKHYYCSECKSMGVDYWDYCPNCGCRMVEPQEQESEEISKEEIAALLARESEEMAIKALEQEPCDVSDTNIGKMSEIPIGSNGVELQESEGKDV